MWKDAFDFEDKNLCNSLNTLKVKHPASYLFNWQQIMGRSVFCFSTWNCWQWTPVLFWPFWQLFSVCCCHLRGLVMMIPRSRCWSVVGNSWLDMLLLCSCLSDVKWELMKPARRPGVRLRSETGMFLCMPSPLISGGPLLSLLCSAEFVISFVLLVGGVDSCASCLVRLICCQLTLIARSPCSLLIWRSLTIRLLVLPPFQFQVEWG